MVATHSKSSFTAKLRLPAEAQGDKESWAFVVLPKKVSETLPRRGRTSVEGTINGKPFVATLEPDGQLSHWLKIDKTLLKKLGAAIGNEVTLEIAPVAHEPEPEVPLDLRKALAASPAAKEGWKNATILARIDWIHWITTAKQAKTRALRVEKACSQLAAGKLRVCCFDPSGYYSKAFGAPKEAT